METLVDHYLYFTDGLPCHLQHPVGGGGEDQQSPLDDNASSSKSLVFVYGNVRIFILIYSTFILVSFFCIRLNFFPPFSLLFLPLFFSGDESIPRAGNLRTCYWLALAPTPVVGFPLNPQSTTYTGIASPHRAAVTLTQRLVSAVVDVCVCVCVCVCVVVCVLPKLHYIYPFE